MRRDERDSPTAYGSLTPEEAMSLVGNELRWQILWALSDERSGDAEPPALSFSELRERVDPAGDSSQFNYHLQQLVGRFVERREEGNAQLVDTIADSEPGYALRPEGTALVRTFRAAIAAGRASVEPFDVGLDCHFCDGAVEAAYENGLFKLQCPDCDYLYDYNLTPPGVLADDEDEILAQVAEYNRHVRLGFARGVCPLCASGVNTTFVDPENSGYPREDRRKALVRRWCDNCGHNDHLLVGEALLADAGLVSFCYERGLDATTTPIWELEFAATDRYTTVRSTDPWKVELAVELDGDTLTLVVDDELDVVERTRS